MTSICSNAYFKLKTIKMLFCIVDVNIVLVCKLLKLMNKGNKHTFTQLVNLSRRWPSLLETWYLINILISVILEVQFTFPI